jgi:hypothetical protein
MIESLANLPASSPDPARAERTRRRCHAALAKTPARARSRGERLLLTACAAYLVSAVFQLFAFL